QGALGAGLTAAVVYLAHPKMLASVGLGIVVGFMVGGPEMIPIAVVAAVVAQLLPAVKDQTKPTGEQVITEVR
ncbi:MAG: branched-subunit amino acid ABC-type transport system permease component, partial [Actinomycetes bacterium]